MPFVVPLDDAQKKFPEYIFLSALTPSEQKAAFHVQDATGRDLCLKIISPDYSLDRLNREITALQNLSHPNIVRLEQYTFSSKPGETRHFMLEEFVQGRDLADLLDAPLPLTEAAALFQQIAAGLEVLRLAELVHRDLKPHNIRIRHDGVAVIIDFGVARHLTLPDLTRTSQGTGIGTPAYFAPEQFEGTKRDIDHRTDLFAFGTMLYQSITGRHPFMSFVSSMAELQEEVCRGRRYLSEPAFLALPRQWQMLIARLLETDRVRRPSGAGKVAELLTRIGATT